MTNLNQAIDEDLRLAILRLLSTQPSYTASVGALHRVLTASREFHVAADRVQACAEWLRDNGFVQTEELGRGVVSVTALPTGRAVAAGQVVRKGITPYDPSQG